MTPTATGWYALSALVAGLLPFFAVGFVAAVVWLVRDYRAWSRNRAARAVRRG